MMVKKMRKLLLLDVDIDIDTVKTFSNPNCVFIEIQDFPKQL